MARVLTPSAVADLSPALPTPDRRAIRPGRDYGRCMADAPPRPCLRAVRDLRLGQRFVMRLTRAVGTVVDCTDRRPSHLRPVKVLLRYRANARAAVVRLLHPSVLVELA